MIATYPRVTAIGYVCAMVAKKGSEEAGNPPGPQPEPESAGSSASPDWPAIRADYEDGEKSLKALAAEHKTTVAAIRARARRKLWSNWRRTGRVDRAHIIARMFHVIETQVIALEEHTKSAGDKEAAVLGRLANTLDKLIEIETAARIDNKPAGAAGRDMKELRDKLAERIAQLKRG